MKKVLSVLLSLLLMFGVCVNGIHAFSESDIENSYTKVLDYYKTETTLYGLDEIIALGNAGIDVSTYTLATDWAGNPIYNPEQTFDSTCVGNLAKHIIVSIFLGKNPKDINGKDLVTLLESLVEDGSAFTNGDDADNTVWVLYALECVGSKTELIEKAADELVANQITTDTAEGRDNDKGGYNSVWGVSMDTVGYVIEALILTGNEKYQSNIDEALAYLFRKQGEDGGFDPNDSWGPSPANTDTQAAVLQGLLVYDKEGVLADTYDGTIGEVSDYAVKYQNVNGSFINGGWDATNWDPTTAVANTISTGNALKMLSTYKNGSFVLNANKKYVEMNAPKPSIPEGPNTGDNSGMYTCFMMMLLSGNIMSRGLKKKYE